MPISSSEFKQAMQRWASGVCVVTTQSEIYGLQGMTVSAFSSVSAEPPLILCCLNSQADSMNGIVESQHFGVNFLTRMQQETSNQFAGRCSHEERFKANPWYSGATTGVPLLTESLVSLECQLINKVRAGSHWIVIGQIEATEIRTGEPLLYYCADYKGLAENHPSV
jgi:flavin reductase (DIM6/NTAB) family NADH-FMN oxidoreductase RutF